MAQQQAEKLAPRDALLRVARREFATKGYDGVSTRELLSDVGVTAPVLYHHFGSKAGLYCAVAEAAMDEITAEVSKHIAGAASWDDVTVGVLDACVSLQRRDTELATFVSSSSADLVRHIELQEAGTEMNRLRDLLEISAVQWLATPARARRAVRVLMTNVYGISRYASVLSPREFAQLARDLRTYVGHDAS